MINQLAFAEALFETSECAASAEMQVRESDSKRIQMREAQDIRTRTRVKAGYATSIADTWNRLLQIVGAFSLPDGRARHGPGFGYVFLTGSL
ncbi:MAG: hypothetical protein KDG52_12395 [Rhodocyclaceae bacterium]|nr:hypothetical protein [Rhodocyclaceae bacterium]